MDEWYLDYTKGSGTYDLETLAFFLRFLTLMSLFIPISLKVTIDFLKLFSSLFIKWDLSLWREDSPDPSYSSSSSASSSAPLPPPSSTPLGHGAIARSTALAEEMGQITHVLSDKTGTLTQNIMEFTGCAIDASRYGLQTAASDDSDSSSSSPSANEQSGTESKPQGNPLLDDEKLRQRIEAGDETALEFFRALAICHSIQTFSKFVFLLLF